MIRIRLMVIGSDHVDGDLLKAAVDNYWINLIPFEAGVMVKTTVLNQQTYVVFETRLFYERLSSLQLNAPKSILGVDNVKSQELSRDEIVNAIRNVEKLNHLEYNLIPLHGFNLKDDPTSQNPVDISEPVDPPT